MVHIAKIKLNNEKFKGTLDFYVIRKVQEDLKENGFDYKVKDIFESLADIQDINMHTVVSILLHSIIRIENVDEEIIEESFINSTREIEFYTDLFKYINTILDKCMPTSNKNKDIDDMFEEEDTNEKDWDFDYIEYLWYSVLKRTDNFYSITPKTFFKQMDIWKKMNNVKEENVNYM